MAVSNDNKPVNYYTFMQLVAKALFSNRSGITVNSGNIEDHAKYLKKLIKRIVPDIPEELKSFEVICEKQQSKTSLSDLTGSLITLTGTIKNDGGIFKFITDPSYAKISSYSTANDTFLRQVKNLQIGATISGSLAGKVGSITKINSSHSKIVFLAGGGRADKCVGGYELANGVLEDIALSCGSAQAILNKLISSIFGIQSPKTIAPTNSAYSQLCSFKTARDIIIAKTLSAMNYSRDWNIKSIAANGKLDDLICNRTYRMLVRDASYNSAFTINGTIYGGGGGGTGGIACQSEKDFRILITTAAAQSGEQSKITLAYPSAVSDLSGREDVEYKADGGAGGAGQTIKSDSFADKDHSYQFSRSGKSGSDGKSTSVSKTVYDCVCLTGIVGCGGCGTGGVAGAGETENDRSITQSTNFPYARKGYAWQLDDSEAGECRGWAGAGGLGGLWSGNTISTIKAYDERTANETPNTQNGSTSTWNHTTSLNDSKANGSINFKPSLYSYGGRPGSSGNKGNSSGGSAPSTATYGAAGKAGSASTGGYKQHGDKEGYAGGGSGGNPGAIILTVSKPVYIFYK